MAKKLIFVALLLILLVTACKTAQPTGVIDQQSKAYVNEDGTMKCSLSEGIFPKPNATVQAVMEYFPAVSEADWQTGAKTPVVTIIEYSDFQCPACASFYPVLEELKAMYPKDVSVVFRHFPLTSIHDKAMLSAQAAEAAGLQNKFWEMYDLLFSTQATWSSMGEAEFTTWLLAQAKAMKLNVDQFAADLTSEDVVARVSDALTEATTIGIPGTPFILINGRPWQASRDLTTLSNIVKVLKYENENTYTTCPNWVLDLDKQYSAVVKTEKGSFTIDLFADKAPLAVNSFVFLAREGYFNGVTFHRVIAGFVAQAGDPTGTGYSGPGYYFNNEVVEGLLFDQEGMVGMANSGENYNGSQWFVTYAPAPNLDGGYTIFGQVVDGMAVVKTLTERDPSTGADLPAGDKIISITIEEK